MAIDNNKLISLGMLQKAVNALKELMIDKLIIKDDEKFYHHSLYNAEKNIAEKLLPFINRKIQLWVL